MKNQNKTLKFYHNDTLLFFIKRYGDTGNTFIKKFPDIPKLTEEMTLPNKEGYDFITTLRKRDDLEERDTNIKPTDFIEKAMEQLGELSSPSSDEDDDDILEV